MTLAAHRARAARARSRRACSTSRTTSSGASFGNPSRLVGRNHGETGAGLERRRDEVMAVAALARDGEERLARLERAAVDGDAGDSACGSAPCAVARIAAAIASAVHSARSHATLPPSAAATAVVVGERQYPVADDLAGFVALAGDQQHVAGLQLRDGVADRLAAVADLDGAGRRARIAARIAAGFSLRGLSSVTMTRSAFSAAIAPMSGRLPGSRSPPAPNTTTSRPVAHTAAARPAPWRARRACGRNRQRSARRRARRRARAGPSRPRAFPAPRTPPPDRSPSRSQARGDKRVRDLEGADQRQAYLEWPPAAFER